MATGLSDAEVTDKKTAKDYIKSADSDLKQIRKLAAKPHQRWFGIGPKKKLTNNDRQLRSILERNEVSKRATGMKMLRQQSRKSGR